MNNTSPTREDLEHPNDGIQFIIEGVDAETSIKAKNSLIALIRELIGASETPDSHCLWLGHLRTIHFALDLPSEIRRWQRQLKHPEFVTDTDDVFVGGKAFVWGDGMPNTTYGIILLPSYIAIGLAEGRPASRRAVAHELAHIDLDLKLILGIGPDLNDYNHVGDWGIVGLQLAVSAIAEAYAERVASRFTEDTLVIETENLLITMATGTLGRVRDAVAAYRHDGNMGHLWGVTILEVSGYLNQLGRVAGLVRDEEDLQKVDARLGEIHLSFRGHLSMLRDAFVRIGEAGETTRAAFAPTITVVQDVLKHFGVIPIWDGERLKLDVPFWPGDLERAQREHQERLLWSLLGLR